MPRLRPARFKSSRTTHQGTTRRLLMRSRICILPLMTTMAICQLVAQNKPDLPADLNPPPDIPLTMQAQAEGYQIYECQTAKTGVAPASVTPSAAPQFAWVLSGPEATLTDDAGKEVAKHSAGPVW